MFYAVYPDKFYYTQLPHWFGKKEINMVSRFCVRNSFNACPKRRQLVSARAIKTMILVDACHDDGEQVHSSDSKTQRSIL